MSEAEKAAKKAAQWFWSSIVMLVLSAALYLASLQFQAPPTGMGSQRVGVTLAVIFGFQAWFHMASAYRSLVRARRAESEALQALLKATQGG